MKTLALTAWFFACAAMSCSAIGGLERTRNFARFRI